MSKILIVFIALMLSNAVHAKQIFENTDMTINSNGWSVWSGDSLTHISNAGHFSALGATVISGNVDGVTAVASVCVDVRDWVYFADLKATGSVSLSKTAGEDATAGIAIYQYTDADCIDEIDSVIQDDPAVPGEWTAIKGDFSLLEGAGGIRVVVFSTNTPNGTSVMFDDITLNISRAAEELFANPDISETMEGWKLYWGHQIIHDLRSGHLTPDGAIRTEGAAVRESNRGGFTGMSSDCVDLTNRSPLDQYKVAASSRPDGDADSPEMGLYIYYYSDTRCKAQIGKTLFFEKAYPSVWTRLEGTFVPPDGAKTMLVVVASLGISEEGGALFDDISLSLTPAVRQVWLIGVGEISNQQIKPTEMQYTRGGSFGGNFDPASLSQETLVNLEVEFDGCNSGRITYQGDGLNGSYPIARLARNEAVASCEARGFRNMGDDNGWMAGYWFGAPDHEGEGFVFDVLAGGAQAVVTWYTYMPDRGIDSTR